MNVVAALLMIGKKVETTQYPSTEEWVSKRWYSYTVEYYLAIKRNEVLIMIQHG